MQWAYKWIPVTQGCFDIDIALVSFIVLDGVRSSNICEGIHMSITKSFGWSIQQTFELLVEATYCVCPGASACENIFIKS